MLNENILNIINGNPEANIEDIFEEISVDDFEKVNTQLNEILKSINQEQKQTRDKIKKFNSEKTELENQISENYNSTTEAKEVNEDRIAELKNKIEDEEMILRELLEKLNKLSRVTDIIKVTCLDFLAKEYENNPEEGNKQFTDKSLNKKYINKRGYIATILSEILKNNEIEKPGIMGKILNKKINQITDRMRAAYANALTEGKVQRTTVEKVMKDLDPEFIL